MKHGWGTSAVVLGAWEATAYLTGRLPTITDTYARCSRRRRRLVRLAFAVWCVGLYLHLDRYMLEEGSA